MFLISTSIRVMFSIRLILCMRAATSPPTRLSLRSSEALTAVNSSLTIIENEGLAIYQLAKSFAGLQTLAGIAVLPVGKTVWSGDYSTYQWSGKRLLDEINEENGPNSGITINSTHRSLFTTRPIWCSFFGVTCGDVSGTPAYASVVELFLDSLSLNGTLTDSIGNFRSITTFSMGSNYVYGSIPSAINNWSGSISKILLFQNLFQGTIPEVFSKFSKLTDIQLNENYFIGTIPSFIGSLSSLTVLQLFSNNFVGSIPSTIGNINKLERLRLEGNSLVGSIPNSITKLLLLDLLYLSSNSLTGTIPSNINALTRLSRLQADRNQLTGTIPYMADLSELFILDLFSNKLTMGSFSEVDPAIFSELTLQGPMNLSSNCLTLVTKGFFAPATCQQRGVPTSQPTIRNMTAPSNFRSLAPSLSSSSNPSPSPVMSVSLQPVQDSSSPTTSTSTLSAPPTPSSLSSPSPSVRPSIRTFEPSNSYDVTSAINVNVKKKNSLSPFDSEASTDYFIVGIIIGTAGAVGAVYMVFMKTCILKV